jgi:hypothetical protein
MSSGLLVAVWNQELWVLENREALQLMEDCLRILTLKVLEHMINNHQSDRPNQHKLDTLVPGSMGQSQILQFAIK